MEFEFYSFEQFILKTELVLATNSVESVTNYWFTHRTCAGNIELVSKQLTLNLIQASASSFSHSAVTNTLKAFI